MTVYATIYDNENNRMFDVSQVVGNISVSTYIQDQPGKCTFDIIVKEPLTFKEGATFSLQVDGMNVFRGTVFKRKATKDEHIVNVTCYDRLRYLKNKDSAVFENMTSSQIFKKICDNFVIPHKIVDESKHICAPRSHDAVELYKMISHALTDTLINTKQWFIIRDNFGVLEHVNVYSLQSGLMIGDQSGLYDFEYETSIDDQTYNQIKLYRDDKKQKKRSVYIVNDTVNGGANLKKWGILQLYEKVPENLNLAQIEQRALGMLRLYNAPTKKLTLQVVDAPPACFKLFAGAIFRCSISKLGDESLDSYMLVTDCTHTIRNNEHTVKISTEVIEQ